MCIPQDDGGGGAPEPARHQQRGKAVASVPPVHACLCLCKQRTSLAFCATCRKGLRRVWGVPYCRPTHSSLLPLSYLHWTVVYELPGSLFRVGQSNCFCCCSLWCFYGRMNSHLGRNAFFCCFRYDVSNILPLLDTWFHVTLTRIFLHNLDLRCRFCLSCCF